MTTQHIMCQVLSLTYDHRLHRGILRLAPSHSPNFSPVIELFEIIDPDVREIQIWSGDIPDLLYQRHGERGWECRIYSRP